MSSAYRITQRSMHLTVGRNLQTNLQKLQQLQQQLSSGRQLAKPSDSPTGTISALRFRSDLRRADQLKRNADDGIGWLGTADTTLTSGLDLVNRARSLLQQGVNGSMSQADRDAIAVEVDQLQQQAIALGNTTYLGRPIFAGTANVTQAYSPTGVYQGNNGAVDRSIAPGVSLTVNLTGPQAFGPAGADLITSLGQIANDLRTNPNNLGTDQTALDAVFSTMNNALAQVGARYNQVQTMRDKVDASQLDTQNALAEVESVDLPATIVQLQLQETAYQAALSATAKVVQPSLVDFLR